MRQYFKCSYSQEILEWWSPLNIFFLNMKHVLLAEDIRILNKYKTQFIHPSERRHPVEGSEAWVDTVQFLLALALGTTTRLSKLSLRNPQEHLGTYIRCVLNSVYRELNLTPTLQAGTCWPDCTWTRDIKALFLLWPSKTQTFSRENSKACTPPLLHYKTYVIFSYWKFRRLPPLPCIYKMMRGSWLLKKGVPLLIPH